MTHSLVRKVRAALEKAADPTKATGMQAYMKSSLPYRGVTTPVQRRLVKPLFASHPLGSSDEWRDVILGLWRPARYREERYAAIALADLPRYAPYRTGMALPLLEELIATGAWWDYVDPLATHCLGDVLRAEPRRTAARLRRWASDPDMWKRRAAILAQIRFKADTDVALLYACIEPNVADREFFVRKAIGWALRQYAWTDAREVQRYVAQQRHALSGLSIREALKNVGPGR